MTPLTALLLATPWFGMSLTPPSPALAPPPGVASPAFVSNPAPLPRLQPTTPFLLSPRGGSLLAQAGGQMDDTETPTGVASSGPTGEAAAEPATTSDTATAPTAATATGPSLGEQLAQRKKVARIHKAFGLSTWTAMTATVALGFIQYHNLYGFFADRASTPCVKGDAIFGQGQCSGKPWPHAAAAGVTAALYTTTFALSFLMPDPLDIAHQKTSAGHRLRLHKALRWVHLSGMIAQILLGVVIANGSAFGLDRANHYKTLRALATVHMATGLVTYGALTAAGAIMIF